MGKNDEAPYLGIDLGGTNIQAALVIDGKIEQREDTKTKADEGTDEVIRRIVKCADKLIEAGGLKRGEVAGLGIGAPGAIDIGKGTVIKAPNLGWKDYPLKKVLGDEFGFPVVVDNDVNVGAWGEFKAGAGRGFDDLFAIFVGTGVGGGLVLNGRLFHGANHTAGEIGHTLLRADAGLGRRTVEDLASRTSMADLLVRLIESGRTSKITQIVEGDYAKVRSKVLAQALKEGDELAVEVIGQAARHLGVAIAGVVTLLSLPCVVVGGGATEAMGKTWLKWINESFEACVFPQELRSCKVLASTLGDDAGPLGAALLAAAQDPP
jgi:glucokinase